LKRQEGTGKGQAVYHCMNADIHLPDTFADGFI